MWRDIAIVLPYWTATSHKTEAFLSTLHDIFANFCHARRWACTFLLFVVLVLCKLAVVVSHMTAGKYNARHSTRPGNNFIIALSRDVFVYATECHCMRNTTRAVQAFLQGKHARAMLRWPEVPVSLYVLCCMPPLFMDMPCYVIEPFNHVRVY